MVGCLWSFGVYYHIAFVEEMRCNFLGGVQISSAISLKVNDEIFHPLFFQLFKSFRKFLGSLFGKARYTYIACCGVGHIACVDTVYGYIGAGDGKINKPGHILTHYLDVDARALGPAQAAHDVGILHFYTGDNRVVDLDYPVARQYAYTFRRPSGYGRYHIQRVRRHIERDANSGEVAVERFVEFLGLFGGGIYRMRVEGLEHCPYGLVYDCVSVDRLHIIVRYEIFRNLEFSAGRGVICAAEGMNVVASIAAENMLNKKCLIRKITIVS